MLSFYEFFAGGGMARLGLGRQWKCLFANDIDPKKVLSYRTNFAGSPELLQADVASISTKSLPGHADLVWASFPCQDLSLAGSGAGLSGNRSGAFWPFWRLIEQLVIERRQPSIVAVENVCGTMTSHGGRDFAAIAEAFSRAGYLFGAFVLDAAHFVPQSRPRLFIVGVSQEKEIPKSIVAKSPQAVFHPASLMAAQNSLSPCALEKWRWWRFPVPNSRTSVFADFIEEFPPDVSWASLAETRKILAQMSPINLAKVQAAQLTRQHMVGCIYRRTRFDEFGKKVQRAEVRFDNIAGCLRTPGGGSSRQRILVVEGGKIRTRLLSAREAARLMGLPEQYILPDRYNEAYHLIGDGVAVPVVRHLAEELFSPLLRSATGRKKAA